MKDPLVLDCNIFGLQRYGGISNYWARIVGAAQRDWGAHCTLLLPEERTFVDMPGIASPTVTERWPNRISRYLRAPVPVTDAVFHTGYYRLPSRKVRRYVVSVYDFTYERYRTGLARAVHKYQKERAIRAADIALCISESTRSDLLAQMPDVDPAKVLVTPLAADPSIFYRDVSAELGAQAPYILFVGQRGGYKRFDLAVDALIDLPHLRLGIVGPPLSDAERAQLNAALGDRWIEFGSVPNEKLRQLYSSAYAFVFPSDYEGFGLPLLEAMACGCPVVAADRSSFPEVVGDAGLLAQAQAAGEYASLFARLSDDALRASLVAGGVERSRAYSWEKTLAQTFAAYR